MEQPIVQSVERTFKIVELLTIHTRGLGLLEIAKETGLHKSTAHRLLSCLIQMGYIVQDESTSLYRLSLKLFELSSRLVDGTDLLATSKPYLDKLSQITNEAVHLVIPSDVNIVYVYKVDAFNGSTVRMASRVGLSIPMYCTGCGKAILANMTQNEIASIWKKSSIDALTTHTIINFDEFCQTLNDVKENGYALDNQENEIGVRCVAFPILDYNHRPVAAFSISAPTTRMTDERIAEILPHARKALSQIATSLGYLY